MLDFPLFDNDAAELFQLLTAFLKLSDSLSFTHLREALSPLLQDKCGDVI